MVRLFRPGVLLLGLLCACASPAPSPSAPAPFPPVHLDIPALAITSPVTTVGLVHGSIGTPCDPTLPYAPCDPNATAWFDLSPLPGAPGNAIIDGHALWFGAHPPLYVPAAFTHLALAHLGDQVLVSDAKGHIWDFKVDSVLTLAYPQIPTGLYAPSSVPTLTLITCGGVYSPALGGLDQRVYVHATLQGHSWPQVLDAPRPLPPFVQPY